MKAIMKQYLSVIVLCAGISAANAIPTPYELPGFGQDIPKNGTGDGGSNANNDADNFFRLQNVIAAYNLTASPLLPTPLNTGVQDLTSPVVGGSGLVGFDYAVLHYGAGDGGAQGSGGGVEFFYLNGATSFTFPANGSGQNGFGGFSSLTLFNGQDIPSVPDTGMTLGLMALGLVSLVVARRVVPA